MTDKTIKHRYFLISITGGLTVIRFLVLSKKAIKYTYADEFCTSCHVHPNANSTCKLSVHNNIRCGISVKCVECHLPHENQSVRIITREAYHGFHDFYVYMTKDAGKIDWAEKGSREAARRFDYEDGCKKYHVNMFPSILNALGAEAHLKYIRNYEITGCLPCYNEMVHYRSEQGLKTGEEIIAGNNEIYPEPTKVGCFKSFAEKIPGIPVSFKMVSIPGGKFNMGTPNEEPYHNGCS